MQHAECKEKGLRWSTDNLQKEIPEHKYSIEQKWSKSESEKEFFQCEGRFFKENKTKSQHEMREWTKRVLA